MLCPRCNCTMEEYVGLAKVEWNCTNKFCGNSPAVHYEAFGDGLDKIAMVNGVVRKVGETDSELRARIKELYHQRII